MQMSFAYQSWEMSSGPSIRCAAEAKGKHWICADESDCMVHSGLSVLPGGLQSQAVTDTSLEDDRFAHGISRARTPSKLSNQCYSVARQELPDLAKPALKGSFSFENNRMGSVWSSYSSKLSVVSEDKPWDYSSPLCGSQDDGSSLSSLSCSGESSSCSLEDVSEVQSSYKGPLASMCSLEEALPRKRGLSGFFAGKSRSFSCLADVTSIKDLVKPENAYARKRKYVSACIGNGDRLRMHPMLSGALGISKKNFHNSKYTVALAVALSAEEGKPQGRFLGPSRSYSLSDLQGAGSHCSPE